MTLQREAYFLIDTHTPSVSVSEVHSIPNKLKLSIASILNSLRESTPSTAAPINIRWSFSLFDSRNTSSSLIGGPISGLTAASLSELSAAIERRITSQTSLDPLTTHPTTSLSPKPSPLSPLSSSTRRLSIEGLTRPLDDRATHSCFLENIAAAVTAARLETSGHTASLDDRESSLTSGTAEPARSSGTRISGASKRNQVLIFLLCACPSSVSELMRAIERPEEQLRSIADPLLDPNAALPYAKIKAKPIIGSFAENFRPSMYTDLSCRLVWVDIRELYLEPQPDLRPFFGTWDRIGNNESASSTSAIGAEQIIDMLKPFGVPVFSLASVLTLAHSIWPSDIATRLFSTPFTASNVPKSRKGVRISIGEQSFACHLESDPTSANLPPTLVSCLSTTITEIVSQNWSACSVVCPKLPSQIPDWQDLMSTLQTTSSSLICIPVSNQPQSFFAVVPVSRDQAYLLHLAQPSVQDLESRIGSFIPKSSATVEHLLPSTLSRSVSALHQAIRSSEMKEPLNLRTKFGNRPTSRALLFAPDPIKDFSQASNSTLSQQSTQSLPGNDAESKEKDASSTDLSSQLFDYFSDFYSRHMGIERAKFNQATHFSAFPKSSQDLVALNFSATHLLRTDSISIPPDEHSDPNLLTSRESSMARDLADFMRRRPDDSTAWKRAVLDFVRRNVLLSEASLRTKYLPDNEHKHSTPSPTNFDQKALVKRYGLQQVKLTEYRIQAFLLLESWQWENQITSNGILETGDTTTNSGIGTLPALPIKLRKQLSFLFETICFLMSLSDFHNFYQNYLIHILNMITDTKTAQYFQKRYEPNISEVLTSMTSTRPADSKPSTKSLEKPIPTDMVEPGDNASFLFNLALSTAAPSSRAAALPPLDALAKLKEKASSTTYTVSEDDLSPRRTQMKRQPPSDLQPPSSAKKRSEAP